MTRRTGLAILASIAALAVLALFFRAQRPAEDTDAGHAPPESWEPSTESFGTWNEFASSTQRQAQERHVVVFIGIDGATWNVIEPMIAQGLLPTFDRLRNTGSWGTLRSVECFVSPPAWTSMMTGCLPEKTGIYTFGHWKHDEQVFMPVSAEDIQVPSVWDISSLAGKRTAVANVPMTYPVRAVDGIMVGGFLVPTTLADRMTMEVAFQTADLTSESLPTTYSPVLWATFPYSRNQYTFALSDTRDDGNSTYDHVTLRLEREDAAPEERVRICKFSVGEFSPWLKVNTTTDETVEPGWCRIHVRPKPGDPSTYLIRFSHTLFSAGETNVTFTYPDTLARVLQERFGYYFPQTHLDAGLLEDYTEDGSRFASFFYDYDDWDLFLYSFNQTDNAQHLTGDSEITKRVYQRIDRHLGELLQKLPENATLVVASDHGGQGYDYIIDLNKLLERLHLLAYKDGTEIDHENTVVFHNMWCLYFNPSLMNAEELERRGVAVAAGESPKEALVRHLEAAGRSLTDEDTGARFPIEFSRIGPGAVGYAPDLVVRGGYTGYHVEFWNLKRPHPGVIRPWGNNEWDHTREGIYIVHGKGARQGARGVNNVEDIAPTILYLLNLPSPPNLDGRVMTNALDPRELAARPRYVIEDFSELQMDAIVSKEERESLEKKLKSLGYVR